MAATWAAQYRSEALGFPPASPDALSLPGRVRGGGGAEVQGDDASTTAAPSAAPQWTPAVAAALQEYEALLQDCEAERARRPSLGPKEAEKLRSSLTALHGRAVEALLAEHRAIQEIEKANERLMIAHGDIPEEGVARYKAARDAFESLRRSCAQLGDAMDLPPPDLPRTDATTRIIEVDPHKDPVRCAEPRIHYLPY